MSVICVNVLLFGGMKMVMVGDFFDDLFVVNMIVNFYVLGWMVMLNEIVRVVFFFVLDVVSFVIGFVMFVDGGSLIKKI